ncbi:hypothetical protein ACP70R_046253 [Stipagrostis hirtigluma subsp. patula]
MGLPELLLWWYGRSQAAAALLPLTNDADHRVIIKRRGPVQLPVLSGASAFLAECGRSGTGPREDSSVL